MSTNKGEKILQLENTYAKLPAVFYSLQKPVPVSKPNLVLFNKSLAKDLGLDLLNQRKEIIIDYFSGNKIPNGSKPLSQAYAGHQFGHFTMLGDGRAVLLGEHVDPSGNRLDIQLKGSGQTPYSRRGDGRASLYSMLREYLISESMHHLGIPTTRSLAVVSTGEKVYREKVHNGAILTRIAASHIRVGTFEYVSNFCSKEELKTLTNYTIKRHYPELSNKNNPALKLLEAVMHKQINLIVNWMRVGFIHGVMNTDNMSIAGETIDYGPCAFMNSYNLNTVFSSIDTYGRYAYGNQPNIVQWNLTAFANSLLPIIAENQNEAIDLAKEVLKEFQHIFKEKWHIMMFDKLGIHKPKEEDKELVNELLSLMKSNKSDYTQVFLALQYNKKLDNPLFHKEEFNQWIQNWKNSHNEPDFELMKRSNPKIIPRNHWVEDVLEAAVEGNLEPFNELLSRLSKPYSDQPEELIFENPQKDFEENYQTFCGT